MEYNSEDDGLKCKILILYDSEPYLNLITSWGFSCYLETPEAKLLFDTGWDGELLLSNMNSLGIDPRAIDKIVISHAHWDHIGGLPSILAINSKITVYALKSFSKNLKREIAKRAKLVEVAKEQEISSNIYTTGELGKAVKEQSLIVKSGKIYIITGCAHPKLSSIFSIAMKYGEIRGIIGGLHNCNEYSLLKNLELLAPCHCTYYKKQIASLFPNSFRNAGVGWSLELEEAR
ncbi:MAG: MBL fold metallo-hydrolase [Halobacteria archaeon]